jgi:hypothetical protein
MNKYRDKESNKEERREGIRIRKGQWKKKTMVREKFSREEQEGEERDTLRRWKNIRFEKVIKEN